MRIGRLFAFPPDRIKARRRSARAFAFDRNFPDITRKQPLPSETGRGLLYRSALKT